MSFNFTLFFERIGGIGGLITDVNTFQSTNLPTDTNYISSFFTGGDLVMIDGFESQQASAQNTMTSYPLYWQSVAADIVNFMILQFDPLLTETNTVASLQQLIALMQASSITIQQHNCAVSVTPNLVLGNGVCAAAIVTPDGLNCQMGMLENVTVACTQDTNTNSGLAGNETFGAQGQVGYNPMSWQYNAGGSGASVTTGAINASANNSFGTLINNGDFETWTVANVPDNWEVITGTPGGTILEGSVPYTGSHNLQFAGNGSELTAIAQTFGTDTPSTLNYGFNYFVNCWVKMSATPAAGVLQLALVDGTNTVINNQQGVPNKVQLNLTGVSTTYVPLNACFQLPQVVPSTIKLQISLSTALSAGKTVDIDRIGFGLATTLYPGGPCFAIFSGSSNFYAGLNNSTPGDLFTITVTNSGRPANGNTFLWLLDRLYNLKGKSLIFPTAGSPTISDSLITT